MLWLSDWSALSLNCVSGGKTTADDLKAICAAQDLLVGCLRALDPQLMAGVAVRRQSEAILSDPSNYWISVIDGRSGRRIRVLQPALERTRTPPHSAVFAVVLSVVLPRGALKTLHSTVLPLRA